MSLVLYNTFTKREEMFTPADPERVTIYTCGPTVYGRPHIGNYASFLMADLLRRWLEVSGYGVVHVKNITDVGHLVADADEGEDKIEKQARAEKTDPLAIARKYTEQYLEDERALGMLEPQHRPLATETVSEMLAIIRTLVKGGHAYETDDGFYFAVETFPAYGKLSGNTLDQLDAGSRVEVREHKRHPADFALWKKCVGDNARHLLRWSFETGERVQSSGEDASAGFPGWHIECSAMSTKFLGEQIDLHTGGEDNIFPHHECEIAQTECATRKPFVRLWLHRRRINIGEQKMSKSLGNVLDIPHIRERGIDPMDLRYYLLSVHYRTNLKFSWEGLDDARKARHRIVEWMDEAAAWKTSAEGAITADDVAAWRQKFVEAMDADLNTSGALGIVFDCMAWSRSGKPWSADALRALHALMVMIRWTFGCFEAEAVAIPADVQALVDARAAARASKDFAASDRLRDEIQILGFDVRDTADGQKVSKKLA